MPARTPDCTHRQMDDGLRARGAVPALCERVSGWAWLGGLCLNPLTPLSFSRLLFPAALPPLSLPLSLSCGPLLWTVSLPLSSPRVLASASLPFTVCADSPSLLSPPLSLCLGLSFSLWFTGCLCHSSFPVSLSAPLLFSLLLFLSLMFSLSSSVSHFLPSLSLRRPGLSQIVSPLRLPSRLRKPSTFWLTWPRDPHIIANSRQGQGLVPAPRKAEAQRWAVTCSSSLAGEGRSLGDPSPGGAGECGHLCPCACSHVRPQVGGPATPPSPCRAAEPQLSHSATHTGGPNSSTCVLRDLPGLLQAPAQRGATGAPLSVGRHAKLASMSAPKPEAAGTPGQATPPARPRAPRHG